MEGLLRVKKSAKNLAFLYSGLMVGQHQNIFLFDDFVYSHPLSAKVKRNYILVTLANSSINTRYPCRKGKLETNLNFTFIHIAFGKEGKLVISVLCISAKFETLKLLYK